MGEDGRWGGGGGGRLREVVEARGEGEGVAEGWGVREGGVAVGGRGAGAATG